MTPSDLELLQRTARGERAAFDVFVERHQASVFRFARWSVGDPSAAEDVLQQTFLAAWRAAPQARVERGAQAWLLTIARHAAGKDRERRSEIREREQDLETLGDLAGFGDERCTPEAISIASEEREVVEDALTALTPEEREILVLRDIEALDGATTAEMLGLSLAAQKSRLHRARLRLAAELRKRLGKEIEDAR